MRTWFMIFLLTISSINIFGLWRQYQREGDICPLVCVYSNPLGAKWATVEIFGERTIWMNKIARREYDNDKAKGPYQ